MDAIFTFSIFFFFLEEKVVLLLYFSDSKGSDKFYFCLHITKNDFQYFDTSSLLEQKQQTKII